MFYFIANWKLNHLKTKTQEVIQTLLDADLGQTEVVIAPVGTLLESACLQTAQTKLKIAAQNVFYAPKGAFTGECSVGHLKELGVSMAIIGHSERRQHFGENSEQAAMKVKACLEGGIRPILCLGEDLRHRQSGLAEQVIADQLRPVLGQIAHLANQSELMVAYEPVWAIGTGQHADPQQVANIHAFLRAEVGPQVSLLYGGSVKHENAHQLAHVPEVNGFLVGAASLEAESILAILQAAKPL